MNEVTMEPVGRIDFRANRPGSTHSHARVCSSNGIKPRVNSSKRSPEITMESPKGITAFELLEYGRR